MNFQRRPVFTASAALVAASVMAVSPHAMAQAAADAPLWELGAFAIGVSQQAYPGSNQQVNRALALPFFVYRGDVLRADRDTAGIRAIKTPRFEVDIGVAASFGSNSDEIDARSGMRDLGTLVELGPRLKWNLGAAPGGGRWRAEFPLRAVFDLSDGAANRGLSFEPELVLETARAGWRYSASVSAVVADAKLARTFYEVTSVDATPLRPAYAAKRGLLAWRLGGFVSRELGADWRLFGFARLDSVAGAANEDSPLVRQTSGVSVGVGVAYTWMRSQQRGQD
jgi:MipA family protein